MALIERRAADLKAGDILFDRLSGNRLGQLVEDPVQGCGPWVYLKFDPYPRSFSEWCFSEEFLLNVIPWA